MAPPSSPLAPIEAARNLLERISKPALLLVAVSGGSDSTGLLLALYEVLLASGRDDVQLHAVTIDHALRPEAADEAQAVQSLCRGLNIPHDILRWNDEKPRTGLSAAARLARYRLIGEVAGKIGATAIVVGHTLDDQGETIAMRSQRSAQAGMPGLSGMADAVLYNARHWVLRPFLSVRREDIRDYLAAKGEGWFDDPSNEDDTYERVRVRKRARDAEPTSREPLLDRTELASRAAAFVSGAVQAYSGGLIKLNADCLGDDPAAIRYALAALACVAGGRAYPLAAQSMDRVMAFVIGREPGRLTAGRVIFDWRKDGLYLMRENRDVPTITVAPGETASWDERFEIVNRSQLPVTVSGGAVAHEGDATLTAVPAGVLKRAKFSQPRVTPESAGQEEADVGSITMRPLLAPYDLFLPRFDLDLANAIALSLGRGVYPQLPLQSLW
ncbi:tRNA lysidine(34) synthetase TilS [Agrobacterium cavarae]|uniref:tRNA lysidine(34) synthetase TilS n=1 Tax=Agrobacterium cavarae TaxID=2528239 RepID=UPI0028ABC04B|nr:tRNA lysidine(34) synthetase TilS [Agrobacterium cavarae]